MKNIFKRSVKKETASMIQKLDNNQLEKVIGGTDEAERITFKAKEGATMAVTTDTDVRQIATSEGPRYQ